jgi:sulfate transport system permease protein
MAAKSSGSYPFRSRRGVLPGFGLSMGFTVFYLSLLVLIPLSALFFKTASMGWEHFWAAISGPRAVASYKLTLGTSLVAASLNVAFGLIVAWVLVRYRFPGRGLVDALVDLPFALPTAVGGIALTQAYAPNGFIGQHLEKWGIQAAYSPLGIVIALTFIGLPFVVRTVQPVLQELDGQLEESAATLGAGRFQTFRRIIFPHILPALLTGFALAFARAIGEYGSVVFISGNMPMKTEITPLLIMTKLEQYDYAGATGLAVVMLIASFLLLIAINTLQGWTTRRSAAA